MTADKFAEPPGEAGRSGGDGFVVEKALKIFGQGNDIVIAPVAFLVDGFHDHPVEIPAQDPFQRDRRSLPSVCNDGTASSEALAAPGRAADIHGAQGLPHTGHGQRGWRFVRQRRYAGEQFIEDDAE